jgi:hypothetical protein
MSCQIAKTKVHLLTLFFAHPLPGARLDSVEVWLILSKKPWKDRNLWRILKTDKPTDN